MAQGRGRRPATTLLLSGSALLLAAPVAALANPGGGSMGNEGHSHGSSPPAKKSGCGGCGGGGGQHSQEPDPRLQEARRDASRQAGTSDPGGEYTQSSGGVKPGAVSPGDIAALGTAEEALENARREQRQGSLDILSALNTATNKGAGRSGIRLPDANDVAVTAANAGHRAQGLLPTDPAPQNAEAEAKAARAREAELQTNMAILHLVTDDMSGAAEKEKARQAELEARMRNSNESVSPPLTSLPPPGLWTHPPSGPLPATPASAPPVVGEAAQQAKAAEMATLAAQQAKASEMAGLAAQQAKASEMASQAIQQAEAAKMAEEAAKPPVGVMTSASAPQPAVQTEPPPSPPEPAQPPADPSPQPGAGKGMIDDYKSKEQQLKDLLAE